MDSSSIASRVDRLQVTMVQIRSKIASLNELVDAEPGIVIDELVGVQQAINQIRLKVKNIMDLVQYTECVQQCDGEDAPSK